MKSHSKCKDKSYNKGSLAILVILAISLILLALFVRIEVVHRKAEVIEAKLVKRIQRIEDEMQTKVQNMVKEILQSKRIPTTIDLRNHVILGKSNMTILGEKIIH